MNKTYLLPLLLCFISFSSISQENKEHYSKITEIEGDLNNDGIPEKVIVYNTNDSTEFGFIREIQIFKLEASTWVLWTKSSNAILKSQEGGMMGDPFESISIKKGVLVIQHVGGSSWKWSITDKYRYENNEFKLIGYSSNYGKLCESWEDVDFNLVTGKLLYTKTNEKCVNDQQMKGSKKQEKFIHNNVKLTLQNRTIEDVKIVTPKYKAEIYL